MPEVTSDPRTVSRKDDHIRINLDKDVQFRGLTTGLERYRFQHTALPELDLATISIQTQLFNKTLAAPILISSMTGGTERAQKLNRTLAQAAQVTGIAMGLGSMRAILERPEIAHTFQVRDLAPDILLLANLGAVQLNYGYNLDHCRRLIEIVQANALVLHFNPLQEAVQPEGNTNFAKLLSKIESICKGLAADGIPVIAKEVGWGFSKEDCRRLVEVGITAKTTRMPAWLPPLWPGASLPQRQSLTPGKSPRSYRYWLRVAYVTASILPNASPSVPAQVVWRAPSSRPPTNQWKP